MALTLSYDGTIQFTHIPHAAFKVEVILKYFSNADTKNFC